MTTTHDGEPTPTEQLLGTRRTPATPRRRWSVPVIAVGVAVLIAVGGLGFLGGRLTAPAAAVTAFPGAGANPGQGFQPPQGGGGGAPGGGQFGGGGFPGFRGGGGPSVEGSVTQVDGDTLTLELADGQTMTVTLGDETAVSREGPAAREDLAAGITVRIQVDPAALAGGGQDIAADSVTIVD